MGHTGNAVYFPMVSRRITTDLMGEGVVYEGVSDKPMRFRGETGAQDSIIPASDNLLQVYRL